MTKNIFIKSVLRQPVRHLVLALLIAAAAFGFALRATEFVVVQDKMDGLEGFYQPIGFVSDIELRYGFLDWRDTRWLDLITTSPYVEFYDNRSVIAGEMHGVLSTDVVAAGFNYGPRVGLFYVNDVYFYGTLTEIRFADEPLEFRGELYAILYFDVDEIIIGFPELLEVGAGLRFIVPFNAVENNDADALQIGTRYLLRGAFDGSVMFAELGLNQFDTQPSWIHPALVRDRLDTLQDRGAISSLMARSIISGQNLYFLPADDNRVDNVLSEIQDQITLLYRNMRTMRVIPTADMYSIPIHADHQPMFGYVATLRLQDGRMLTHADSINAHNVVVIDRQFATMRGIEVGDTLTITLRENAPAVLPAPSVSAEQWAEWFDASVRIDTLNRNEPWEFWAIDANLPTNHADWQNFRTINLNLEVVGIIFASGFGGGQGTANLTNPAASTSLTVDGTFMYIPAGLVPEDWERTAGWVMRENLFSFMLTSGRHLDDFVYQNEAALFELGYTLHWITIPGAQAFFDAADTITTALTFNIIIFAIVSALVLLLAVFIYMLLTRRNFTITRMLGGKKGKAIVGVIAPAVLFWTPFIAAGAIAAWHLALSTAGNILYDLPRATEYIVTPDITWMLLFIGVTLAAVLLLIGISTVIMSRRPILQLMQAKGK